jgi:hypothetical protein
LVRKARRSNSKLGLSGREYRFFTGHVPGEIEIENLASKLRWQRRDVKRRNAGDSRTASDQALPKGLSAESIGRDDP